MPACVLVSIRTICPCHVYYSQPLFFETIACASLAWISFCDRRTGRQHYRLYTIKNIPSLKVLDYVKISKTERERAERLAQSAAGAALEADVQGEQSSSSTSTTNAKTFIPGEGLDTQKTFTAIFTAEEKEWIRDLVANASSPAEIEEIELSVQRGILPPQLANRKRSADRDSGGGGETADDPPTKKIRNGHS